MIVVSIGSLSSRGSARAIGSAVRMEWGCGIVCVCFMTSCDHTLVCSIATPHNHDRLEQNAQIEPEGVILDVVEILLRVQMHRLLAATIDLPPAGHAGQDTQPLPLPGLILGRDVGNLRARAD